MKPWNQTKESSSRLGRVCNATCWHPPPGQTWYNHMTSDYIDSCAVGCCMLLHACIFAFDSYTQSYNTAWWSAVSVFSRASFVKTVWHRGISIFQDVGEDEPTNHLDGAAVASLCAGLRGHKGVATRMQLCHTLPSYVFSYCRTCLFAARLRQARVIWSVYMLGICRVWWGYCINDQWFNYLEFLHNFHICDLWCMKLFPAASSYLGSSCFSRQGIFGGSAGDRQNYCHSWCSRRTRSFESSLGCNTTTFKPSKTIPKPSTKIKLSEHHGVRIWRNHAFLTAKLHEMCMPFISGACGLCYPGREWALWVSWMHRAVRHGLPWAMPMPSRDMSWHR